MEYSKIIAEAKGRFSNPHPQNFSLPCDMMKYIQKEWSPVVYVKMTATCKYFYASHPWLVIRIIRNVCKFHAILNKGLDKNLKIWVVGTEDSILDMNSLTSDDRFLQLLRSIRFSSLPSLSIKRRRLSYSDYSSIAESKSLGCLILAGTNVTTENDENKMCFLDDLLKPLKNIETFLLNSENSSDYYLESAKRLADFVVPRNLQKLIIDKIPEYISFEYFHRFLKKNPYITFLELEFQSINVNNAFIDDVQRYYSEDLTYETTDLDIQIYFNIFIGNVKIVVSFYKICKNCNQRVANKYLGRCPLNNKHYACKACLDAFQPEGPCPLCLAGV